MKIIKDNSAGKDAIAVLQQWLVKNGTTISVDGIFGPGTRQAVREFQERHQLNADGIAGYRTWEALFFSDRGESEAPVSKEDFKLAAALLDCETATLMAVQKVETGGKGGFIHLPQKRKPTILFEGHVFWAQLKKRNIAPEQYVAGNEDILYPSWTTKYYKGGIKEYERLERARQIHHEAADSSASWGMFQIMGFNHASCGEKTVASFVAMMHKSELHQLLLSLRFINAQPKMRIALQQRDWAGFARLYNGSGYAKNQYDRKLAEAYRSFSR